MVMSRSQTTASLSDKETDALFLEPKWAEQFPPILAVPQVAQLLQVPIQTVYGWSSRGLLDACKLRVGKHRRFLRNRLIQLILENKLNGN